MNQRAISQVPSKQGPKGSYTSYVNVEPSSKDKNVLFPTGQGQRSLPKRL